MATEPTTTGGGQRRKRPAPVEERPRPVGREQVVQAILDSAQRLLSERGPRGVSLRQIAADAGVNYGLVYQYLGTRENLLKTVFRRLSEDAATHIDRGADFHAALSALRRSRSGDAYVRMLAWTLLEGHDPREFLGRSPAMEALARTATSELPDAVAEGDEHAVRTAELAVALAMVLNVGWRMFGDFFVVALSLDDERDRLDQLVGALLHRMPAVVGSLLNDEG